eukprot:TRINITY_DN1816_c0_g1_i1.p1 TRINITY_DN1816_c0_g1~~TRINITY_DN1816_c0_g1_i1.p1  ORF type:complete len:477 (-),score=8.55 TRINITY_DN1816_c0_g1_i1:59-1489(-)
MIITVFNMKASLICLAKIVLYAILWTVLNFWIATAILVSYLVVSSLIFRFILKLKPMDGWTSLVLLRDPGNSLIITSYTVIDQITMEELYEIFSNLISRKGTETLQSRFISVLGNGYWIRDTRFSLNNHLLYYTKRSIHSRKELVEAIGEEAMIPLPEHLPRWQILFIPHYTSGKSAFIFKVYHALGDGISLTSMFLQSSTVEPVFYKTLPRISWFLKAVPYIFFPFFMGYMITTMWSKEDSNCITCYNGKSLSGIRIAAYSGPYPIQPIKDKCRELRITINDFIGTVVAHAFRQYLGIFDERSLDDDSTIQLDMPFTYRDRDTPMTLSVKIGLIPVAFPLVKGESTTQDLYKVHNILELQKKKCCQFYASISLTFFESLLPADLLYCLAQLWSRSSSSVFTNVPGTRNKVQFGNKVVHEINFLSPNIGQHPTAVGVFTYADELMMLLVSDKNRLEHPEKYAELFDKSMNLYLKQL